MKKEQIIQKEIINYLKSIDAYYVKTIVATSGGTPDIICCIDGKFVGIEVKKENGVVSKLQSIHMKNIKKAGGIAFVARSLRDVKSRIQDNG